MEKHILRYEEWEVCGNWYCSATKDVGKVGNLWYTPARAMNMELVDYVKLIITQFKPTSIKFVDGPNGSVLMYHWDKQSEMRKFKNWLNKRMREVQCYV